MGWLIALGVIVLLAMIPLVLTVRYDADGFLMLLILGPFRWQLIPGKKKAEKEKPKNKEPKQTEGEEPKESQPKKGGSIFDFAPLLPIILDLLEDFGQKMRVPLLRLKLTLAGDDPCDLAINYGRTWGAVHSLIPQLERFFVIRKKDIQVQCDFEAETTLVVFRLDISLTLGRLIQLLIRYGIPGFREYYKIDNLRKGGAVK